VSFDIYLAVVHREQQKQRCHKTTADVHNFDAVERRQSIVADELHEIAEYEEKRGKQTKNKPILLIATAAMNRDDQKKNICNQAGCQKNYIDSICQTHSPPQKRFVLMILT
jgi:hypothetical protein